METFRIFSFSHNNMSNMKISLVLKHISLLKATMSNWVLIAAEQWCQPIVDSIHEMLLWGDVIHADETRIQVLHEEGRKATTESKM